MKQRVMGFDVARALAIFGMVIVNFKIALNANTGSAFLQYFAGLFEGRASALFVILAGIGINFLTQKAIQSQASEHIAQARWLLIKRGLLLVILGLAFTPIWEADILHFYGFYFLVAALLFTLKDKALIASAVIAVFTFPLLMMLFDYNTGWHWETLHYTDFWTPEGMIRHIFFNGFHPVFPWCGYLLFGLWLGRQNLSNERTRWRIFWIAVAIGSVIELSLFGLRAALPPATLGLTQEDTSLLLSTSAIPPLPHYLFSATSSATAVLMLCLHVTDRFSKSALVRVLYQTGQLSLTLYVFHVVLGMGAIEVLGYLHKQSIDFAMFCALLFCLFSIAFSLVWKTYFSAGPLEWLFRKLT